MDALVKAIANRYGDYDDAVDIVRENGTGLQIEAIREAVELTRCLRRLVPHCSVEQIHAAFGAPGDFGYGTPIGDALYRIYRGEP